MFRILSLSLLLFSFSSPSLAYDNYGDYGYRNGYQQSSFNSYRVKQLLNEAENYLYNYKVRAAFYKLKVARMESDLMPYGSNKSKVMHALNTAIQKLGDYGLSEYEKINIAQDCINVARRALNNGYGQPDYSYGKVNKALKKMDRAMYLTEVGNYARAAQKLQRARQLLRKVSNQHGVQKAIQALKVMEEKICDSQLSHYEKLEFARDCLSQAYRALQSAGVL